MWEQPRAAGEGGDKRMRWLDGIFDAISGHELEQTPGHIEG